MDKDLTVSVSIIMPVYNAEMYVGEAIESMLGQTFTDFEFIIIDDGSTDNSLKVIEGYTDHRISVIRNLKNIGLVQTLNKGIDMACGKYIARMDADDISLPERLEKQVKFMDKNKDIGASGTAYQLFGDRENVHTPPIGYQKAFTHLSLNSAIGHPSSIIRTDLLRNHNIRYDPEYEYAADYAFWIKISQVSRVTSIDQPLLRYRWHEKNMSNTDLSASRSRGKARVLWYESVLKKPVTINQREYLEGNSKCWKVFEAGKILLTEVLALHDCENLDKTYFGKINVTAWEFGLIRQFGLRGLLVCLSLLFSFRKWSGATVVGLIYQYHNRKR